MGKPHRMCNDVYEVCMIYKVIQAALVDGEAILTWPVMKRWTIIHEICFFFEFSYCCTYIDDDLNSSLASACMQIMAILRLSNCFSNRLSFFTLNGAWPITTLKKLIKCGYLTLWSHSGGQLHYPIPSRHSINSLHFGLRKSILIHCIFSRY